MDKRLIEEVSQWPILYDTHCPEYKSVEHKNAAWREIATNIFGNTDPTIIDRCKNKWKNLRDTFVKSQRKKDKPNSKPWKLEKEMDFLTPHINPKARESINISIQRCYAGSSEDSHNESSWQDESIDLTKRERSEDDITDRILQQVETVMEDTPSRHKRRKWNEPTSNMVPQNLDYYGNCGTYYEPIQCQATYDSLDLYFLSLASTIKGMKKETQIQLKKDISNLVLDKELEEHTAAKAQSPQKRVD